MQDIGISGFACYVPPHRVALEDWCAWRGENAEKIRTVVGSSFRMRGPSRNAYTMAASAVLRLLEAYAIDPRQVGYLALGTESSTDNSAGAVIVKGMVDAALRERDDAPLARQCEVPEFKHACLGGVYALKGATRYLALDGGGRQAIVVCADVAEYARGSSGEATQGAGAIAMLLETDPALLALDLDCAGSAADYRGPDFRKPFLRYNDQSRPVDGQLRDFPVFNAKYSTTCYADEVLAALDGMFSRRALHRADYFRNLAAVFLHRPYRRMPETGWGLGYLAALAAGDASDRDELAGYAADTGAAFAELLAEFAAWPRVYALVEEGRVAEEIYPLAMQVLRAFRSTATYRAIIEDKMRLGAAAMMEVGNLYTAALPAWLAAGLEEARMNGESLAGRELLTIGYGSGDAAEAIPMRVMDGWREAASRIGFAEALRGAVDLTRDQYEALHDGSETIELPASPQEGFTIERIGAGDQPACDDRGIEYYRHVGASASSK